jgi:hypothetical protein
MLQALLPGPSASSCPQPELQVRLLALLLAPVLALATDRATGEDTSPALGPSPGPFTSPRSLPGLQVRLLALLLAPLLALAHC